MELPKLPGDQCGVEMDAKEKLVSRDGIPMEGHVVLTDMRERLHAENIPLATIRNGRYVFATSLKVPVRRISSSSLRLTRSSKTLRLGNIEPPGEAALLWADSKQTESHLQSCKRLRKYEVDCNHKDLCSSSQTAWRVKPNMTKV